MSDVVPGDSGAKPQRVDENLTWDFQSDMLEVFMLKPSFRLPSLLSVGASLCTAYGVPIVWHKCG